MAMDAISMEWAGYLAATMTTLAFVPQAVKTIRTRDTRSISLGMYVVFTIGIGFWLVYGIALDSMPMILSNIVTFVLSATILGLKIKHG
jgi:MtN3 and saliva related transmembrane protein